ncbi:P2Y purinoceptor 13-like [Seriola aureovittata]|uniref:P2Y purinoceptor 13-like n=1 Tax=Seriola aureovittata TaxID=2871759 RepID=UPI0024BE60FB|nr:P2Y purinoceptor 13-like [Seriola aureovittata]
METNNISHLSSDCATFSLVTVDVAVSYLFFFLFPIALLLNGVAAWVSLHLRSTSTFIVYLKNMVAADLLMTLTLPLKAASMLPGATLELRAFACRYSDVIFYCCMYTSIALMGVISLDRFFKIVRPCGKLLGQNVSFSIVMSALVWVVIFGSTAIPTIILTNQDPINMTGNFCMSLKSPVGLKLHKCVVVCMEILFWLISILIVFCYMCITMKVLQSFRNSGSNNSQGKKKTKLRVFLILLVFFVCFVPLHILRIPFTLYEIFNVKVCTERWLVIVHHLALWVSTTNACLDPFLYIYLCREYRVKLADMVKARGICVGLHSGENEDD